MSAVEDLDSLEISSTLKRKLRAAGLYAISDIRSLSRKELVELPGLGEASVDQVLEAIGKLDSEPVDLEDDEPTVIEAEGEVFTMSQEMVSLPIDRFNSLKEAIARARDIFAARDAAKGREQGELTLYFQGVLDQLNG